MDSTFIHSEQIKGKFGVGSSIRVNGSILPHAVRFAVNLQCGPNTYPRDDVALHISPQFERDLVIRNSIIHNNWGPEELMGHFPFQKGSPFCIEIMCEEDGFKISIDGNYFTKFFHRIPYSQITHITLDGDITSVYIQYENSPPSFGFNVRANIGSSQSYPSNISPQSSIYPSTPLANQQPYNMYSEGTQHPAYIPQYPCGLPQPYIPPHPGNYCNPQNTGCYPTQPAQQSITPHPGKSHKAGILEKAGMALAGTALAGGGLVGSIVHGKKALKSHKKAQKKALKYGLPIAGVGLGAYAMKKGFRHGSSSSSSSSSD